ncbi:DUF2264 domain-containing protein [Streptomyces sp. NPDC005151]
MSSSFMAHDRFRLPRPDLSLSPYTGYTRAHWIAVADQLLDRVQRFASPTGARIPLPGRASGSGEQSDALEGFARTFLLLALRTATEGGREDLLERYAEGLAAGVDPASPEAWPRITDPVRQTLVEAASIAIALHLTRARVWDRLAERTRQHTTEWLRGASGLTIPDNNWHLFRVVVGEFLASVGADHDRGELERDLERVEEFWVGDGWYSDGPHAAYDHYCGWAMHTYPVLIDLITGPRPSSPRAQERLRRYLEDAVGLVGSDGSPLFQGRSLIYRVAAAAAPWAGAVAGCSPLAPGQTRRLASGMLRHFVDQGFLGADGVPTLGWYGAYPPIVQSYSAPASPFWLAKGFLGLLLPADHPCWTAPEEPLPAELADDVRDLRAPGWTASATRADGLVRIANHGSDGVLGPALVGDPLYSRLGYSTATSPTPDEAMTPDNHVGLLADDGRVSRRVRMHRLGEPADGRSSSWHEPAWRDEGPAGGRITTVSQWVGAWEVRVHVVEGAPPGAEVLESGWQVAGRYAPAGIVDAGGVRARSERLTSAFLPVTPVLKRGIASTTGTSAFGPHAATPWVRSRVVGDRSVHVSLVGLFGTDASVSEAPPEVRVGEGAVVVRTGAGDEIAIPIPPDSPGALT